jgi:type IV pilus assembly protein PilM
VTYFDGLKIVMNSSAGCQLMKITSTKVRGPRVACEFNAAHIAVGRAAGTSQLDISAVRPLPAGALAPNHAGQNIVNYSAVRSTLQDAMQVLGGRPRDMILILPDGACRVVLLDFETVPEKREDADAIVRFRLKKTLPFDVERARVSWQVQNEGGKLLLAVAVVFGAVLEEYESVLREMGISPGVVLPSMLACLGQVDAAVPVLAIKVDPATTSIAIVNHDALLLTRTLDHPAGVLPTGTQLAEDVYPSLVFFHDTYGSQVQRVLVSGLPEPEKTCAALAEATGIPVDELVSLERIGSVMPQQRAALTAVAGALA